MSFRLTKADMLNLRTSDEMRELALKLKGFGGTECEREEKEKRKARIKDKIMSAAMLPFHWAIGRVTSPASTSRVNGQHSGEVFLELTPEEWKRVVFPIRVSWEEYTCDTQHDLAFLFQQFDAHWSVRTTEDIMGAHLGVHDALRHSICRHVAVCVAGGLTWYRGRVEKQEVSPETQFTLIHEDAYKSFLVWCGSFLSRDKTREMLSRPVVAAMWHTTKDGDTTARDFWKAVASGKAPLDADSVGYKVADFLDMARDAHTEWPNAIKRHFKKNGVRPSDADVFATCLRGFQAMKRGTRIGDIFTPAKNKSPAEIIEDPACALAA